MVILNPKEVDSKAGTPGTEEVVVSEDLSQLCPHCIVWRLVVAFLDFPKGGGVT